MSFEISVTDKITGSRYKDFIFNHESHKIEVSLTTDKLTGNSYKDKYRAIVRWNFGDGTYVEGTSATHYYTQAGKYKISAVLYDLDRVPHENLAPSVEITVREIVPTELSLYSDSSSSWNEGTYYFSKNNKLGNILITVGNEFIGEPQIKPIRKWDNGKNENSYFDIKDEPFYHLKKYYTFLAENYIHSIDEKSSTGILRPIETYKPSYRTLYGKINKDKKLDLCYIKSKYSDEPVTLKLYKNVDGERKSYTATTILKSSDLTSDYYAIGKFALVPIYYKNDYANVSSNQIFFEIDKSTLKFKNEEALNETYLNTIPISFNVNFSKCPTAYKVLTSNGLCSYLPDNEVNNQIFVEKYLEHNFYAKYTVEAYYAYFIPNDKLSNDSPITYNMDKSRSIEGTLTTNNKCSLVEKENGDYYRYYHITPKEDGFNFVDNRKIFYTHGKLENLEKLILPSEKIYNQNIDELLNTYMNHPMYDNAVNLKIMLKDIFANKNMLSYITSKGINFVDDHVNHKSCYIKDLLSLYELLDEPLKQYDISAFEKINDLKELTRIISMNYSHLFGTEINNEYDIKITQSSKGKNIADQLEYNDVILCDTNYNIIGFRRGSKIYKLLESECSPYIVIKDDFTSQTYLGTLHGVSTHEIEDFSDQKDEWKTNNASFIKKVKYAYRLSDYTYRWGWGLNLPMEAENRQDKDYLIDNYYTFYLFKPNSSSKRKYNFLEEKTIPVDNDGKQLSVEDWEENFGFLYNCLVKVLTNNLNLK
jgi:hypothetical protein